MVAWFLMSLSVYGAGQEFRTREFTTDNPKLISLNQHACSGDPYSQYEFGEAYKNGLYGLKNDRDQSLGWYIKAARQGHMGAIEQVVSAYKNLANNGILYFTPNEGDKRDQRDVKHEILAWSYTLRKKKYEMEQLEHFKDRLEREANALIVESWQFKESDSRKLQWMKRALQLYEESESPDAVEDLNIKIAAYLSRSHFVWGENWFYSGHGYSYEIDTLSLRVKALPKECKES